MTVARTLRDDTFDTVPGTIGSDEKGDVTGFGSFAWYAWQEDEYLPQEEARPQE